MKKEKKTKMEEGCIDEKKVYERRRVVRINGERLKGRRKKKRKWGGE